MSAATWPTRSLSIPLTMILVAEGTSKVTPSGAVTLTGWENPRASSSADGPLGMARYPTPTISSSLENPSVTPATMLATNDRVRPCRARFWRWSSGRSSTRTSPSWRMLMAAGTARASSPWGPLTVTVLSSPTATDTPDGTVIGERPTRDISGYLRQRDRPWWPGDRAPRCGYQT